MNILKYEYTNILHINKYINIHMQEDIFDTKTLDSLCISLCTDESKYLEMDSHYLHIPQKLFVSYTTSLNLSKICFELSNPLVPNERVYLKKIEPSVRDFESNVLVPDWVCKKLSLSGLGNKINLTPIVQPQIVKRCKIRGDSSSYVKMDIKTLLENKINNFKCVNLGTIFNIEGVNFKIIDLFSSNNRSISYGLLSTELEIDFDTPDDIKLVEKRKKIMDMITCKIEEKVNFIISEKNKFNKKKIGIFKFSDFKEEQNAYSSIPSNAIDWDEINNYMLEQFEQNSADFEENKNILQKVIEHGKEIQKKMAEQNQNQNSSDSNTNSDNDSNSEKKNFIFNTRAYKLTESEDLDDLKLTKDEIRKARLDKLMQDK